MRLVPRKTLILRKLPLRAELHMRMAHLTYPTLLRQIRGALQVAILRMRTAGGEWLLPSCPGTGTQAGPAPGVAFWARDFFAADTEREG
jgi:hypothetical protein